MSSLCVNFWRSYASLWTKNVGNVQFSALFSFMLWHFELKFCIWLCFTVLQNKFECRQFPSISVGVMPLLELRILILKIHSFPHFSLTRFYILSWNFAFDFVLLCYRSSSSVVNFRQILYARLQTGRIMLWWCPSGSLSVRPSGLSVRPTLRPSVLRPPIFRTFLLHALTYWAEILLMTLFWCTTDQVRLSSLCVNFWRSYASLWT